MPTVYDDIYEPGEDSYLMQKYVEIYSKNCKNVLDMGTGSGIQAITAAKNAKSVLAVDINPKAVKQAKLAVEMERLKNITVRESNLFLKIKKNKFDLIIFNPPYLPKEKDVDDIALFSGKRGIKTTEEFLDNVNEFLSDNGKILLISSSLASQSLLDEALKRNLLENKILEKIHMFFEDVFLHELTKSNILVELNSKKVKSAKLFAKGKRGVIIKGKYKSKDVGIKIKNKNSEANNTVEHEANILKRLNEHKIGPQLIMHEKNFLMYKFVNGEFIEEYFENKSKAKIKKVIKEIFRQLYVLDSIKINKFEMHRPLKHILIDDSDKLDVTLIDFERARISLKPKNVTQFCDFLTGEKINEKLSKKGFNIKREEMIKLSSAYKDNENKKNFEEILKMIFS